MAIVLPNGRNYFATSAGAPLVGGKVYAYVAGTTTPKDTYTTSAAGTPNAHPVVLDSRGEAAIYWVGTYDVVLKDSAGSTIWGPERLSDIYSDLANITSASLGPALIGDGALLVYPLATLGRSVHDNGIDINAYPGIDPTGATSSVAAIIAFFAAVATGSKVIMRGTYKIDGKVTITSKNLTLDCMGSTFNVTNDYAGFTIAGTVTNFDVFGGKLTGDSVNRDADSSKVQVAWTIGNDSAAAVSGVRLWGVWAGNMNQGFRFAAGSGYPGVGGKSFKCSAIGCTAYNMVGTVGGTGYGFMGSQADELSWVNCTAELCARHAFYVAEGKDYNLSNCIAISSGLAGYAAFSLSRSAQITASNLVARACYQGMAIDTNTQGVAPDNVQFGATVHGYSAYGNTNEDLIIGTTAPVADGVPKDVYVQMVARQAAGNTNSSVIVYCGTRVTLDVTIDAVSDRAMTFYEFGGVCYANDFTVRGQITTTGAYGVQIPAAAQTGTNKIRLKFDDITAVTAPFEFISGEDATTNNNLFYRYQPTGGAKRTYSSSAGGAVTIPVGGLELLILSAGAAHTVTTLSGMTEGQRITLYATNGNTTLTNSASFKLVGGGNVALTAQDSITVQCIAGVPSQITPVLSLN